MSDSPTPVLHDPTDRPDLLALKEQVATRVRQGSPAGVAAPPTALVLSGGGGKGAYEAGCLLALWDCGLRRFDAVAGTSVGALNAALFKRLLIEGDRNVVLRVWSDLSFGRVLGGSPWSIVKLLLYVPISVAAFQSPPFIRQTSRSRDDNLQVEMERPLDWFAQLLVGYVSLVVPVLVGSLTLLAIALGLGYALRDIDLSKGAANAALVVAIVAIPMVARLLSRRLGLADNGPLRATVASVYDKKLDVGDPEIICTIANVMPFSSKSNHAVYPSLAKATAEDEALDLLVQSAALPEIFPMKKLHGFDYVDGGVEDNTPILGVYPIQPQRVIVIYLDHRYRLMLERRKRACYGVTLRDGKPVWSTDLALKLWEQNRLKAIAQRRGETWDGPVRSWFWALDLVPVIPSRDLGNLVTGTLNFTRDKARRLIALGYEDTLKALLAQP